MTKYCIAIRPIYEQGSPVLLFETEAYNEKEALGKIFAQRVRDQWGPDNYNRFIDELYDLDQELVYIREINE